MNSSTKIISRYIAVMLFSIGITAITLSRFSLLIQSVLTIPYNWKIESCIVVGQLLFQLPFIWKNSGFEIIRYHYTMLLISLLGSVMLWPIIAINIYDPQPLFVNIIYFFTVVSIMFLTHMYRVKKLHLPHYLCYTWVLYRLLILPFILNY
ncbi:hypothetical protein [uncultured Cytophaga sp.]|uniref:hypothetical protein n=1 Tax=uncultured Cytophaga sp. TaxID=160238 RepID=UPI002635A81B|nr:hypothetical protein [uncultured Cytophaga sp.]